MENKTKQQGYTIVSDEAVATLGLQRAYFLSRLLRWKQYKGTKTFQVSDSVLAKNCGVSDRTIRNYKTALKEAGIIEWDTEFQENGYTVTEYTLVASKINELYGHQVLEEKSLTNKATKPNNNKEEVRKPKLPTAIKIH